MLRAHAWVILPALLALPPPVRAQPGIASGELTLKWDAPAECPSGPAVTKDIERLLGRPLSATSQRSLQADARVAQQGKEWRLRLQIAVGDAGARERALAGDDCGQLAAAAAVIIALAIDPNLKLELPAEPPPTETEPEPEPQPAPETAVAEPAPPAAAAEPPRPSSPPAPTPTKAIAATASPTQPVVWRLGASALIDGFSLPALAPGVELHGGAEWRSIRIELFGLHAFEQREKVAGGGVGIVSLTAGGLRGCLEVREPNFALGPCVSTEVGALAARSEQVASPDRGTSLWWGIGAGAWAGWQVSPAWALELGGEVVLPMTRDRFVIEGIEKPVHQSPDATIRGFLGVTRRFR